MALRVFALRQLYARREWPAFLPAPRERAATDLHAQNPTQTQTRPALHLSKIRGEHATRRTHQYLQPTPAGIIVFVDDLSTNDRG